MVFSQLFAKMKIMILICVMLLCIPTSINSEEQSCIFEYRHWTTKGVGGLYYTCSITNTKLTNQSQPVITKTSTNINSNQKVTAVQYSLGNDLKYIPNSLFDTFTNVQFLLMASVNLKSLKQHYFKNANNLKGIQINGNPINLLEANLFVKAPKLEGINLGGNEINTVHKLAFNGLLKLQWIELHSNKITTLNPWTFTSLSNLQSLKLIGNECINQNFQNSNEIFEIIEMEIRKSCIYQVDVDQYFEYQTIANLTDLVFKLTVQNDQIHIRLNKMEEKSVKDKKDMDEMIEQLNSTEKKCEQRIKLLEDGFVAKAALVNNLTMVEETPFSRIISSTQESPSLLEKINKNAEDCKENFQKIETITLKKFESFTKLIHQGSSKFETRVKNLEGKISRTNLTETKRKLNSFIDQVTTKLDVMDEKSLKDTKLLERLSLRLDQLSVRNTWKISDEYGANITENLEKTNDNLKKIEENCNRKTERIYQNLTNSIDAIIQPQITSLQKEITFVIKKINNNAQVCKVNLVKIEKKSSDNAEVLTKLTKVNRDDKLKFESVIKVLERKIDTGTQKYLANVEVTNSKFHILTQDLESVKGNLNRRGK